LRLRYKGMAELMHCDSDDESDNQRKKPENGLG